MNIQRPEIVFSYSYNGFVDENESVYKIIEFTLKSIEKLNSWTNPL